MHVKVIKDIFVKEVEHMSKCKRLEEYFRKLEETRVRLTYFDVKGMIEGSIPLSAYMYPTWWTTEETEYSEAWQHAGWKVEDVNIGNWVDFVKVGEAESTEVIYNKLVRDGIPAIIESSGRRYEARKADEEEKFILLKTKLQEEVREYMENSNLEELADIMEVLFGLADSMGFTEEELIGKRNEKREEKGGFNEGTVLVKVIE